jgi:hypothetical protein
MMWKGNNLAELPRGEQTFEGVRFQIGDGLIQLAGRFLPRTPSKVEGIAVGRVFAKLHILHATGWGDCQPNVWDGTLVGRYLLHGEDGSIQQVPIVYGKDVRDWYIPDQAQGVTHGALDLKVAWKGSNATATQVGATIRLFLTTWINPTPDRKVVSLDYSSRRHLPTAPFCVAMTLQGKVERDVTFLDLQPWANRRLTDEFHLDPNEKPAVPQPTRVYIDEDYGLKVTAPANWPRWNPAQTAVPGEICRAWSPDGWTGIYLSVQQTGKAITPRALLEARALAAQVDLGAEVHKRERRKVAGMQAVHLAYSGKGNAWGVDGKSEQFATLHWVAIPRARDVIHLTLVAPEDHSEYAEEVFEAMLKTLEVSGVQTEE